MPHGVGNRKGGDTLLPATDAAASVTSSAQEAYAVSTFGARGARRFRRVARPRPFPDEKVPARGGHRAKIRIIPDPAIVRPLFLAVRGPFRHPERPSEANRACGRCLRRPPRCVPRNAMGSPAAPGRQGRRGERPCRTQSTAAGARSGRERIAGGVRTCP